MKYPITPVPKPRQTQRDKWLNPPRPEVARYRAFADEVRGEGVKFSNGNSITFGLPMPKSWSKKKRAEQDGKPHTQVPDADNLEKALFDAIFKDDSHIWHIGEVKKLWSVEGYIIIEEV